MPDVTKIRSLGGGAVLALLIIGVAGIMLAIGSTGGHPEAAAIGLLASAVAFSGIANVIFRS